MILKHDARRSAVLSFLLMQLESCSYRVSCIVIGRGKWGTAEGSVDDIYDSALPLSESGIKL